LGRFASSSKAEDTLLVVEIEATLLLEGVLVMMMVYL
jgi:hypothetical protein